MNKSRLITLTPKELSSLLAARAQLTTIKQHRDRLLEVAWEIANDSRVDLVDSGRKERLYSAIEKAGRRL